MNECTTGPKEFVTTCTQCRPVQVLHLCPHCNKESEAEAGRDNGGITITFYNCPHCGKRNDVWINILIGDEPPIDPARLEAARAAVQP